MNAHGLRSSKIVRMSQSGNTGNNAIHFAENSAPSRASIVAGDAVLAFGCEKGHVLLLSPIAVPADGDATISIVRQEKRTVARGLLRRNDVEHRIRLLAGSKGISLHGPELIQRVNRFRRAQIDVSKPRREASMHGTAPRTADAVELDGPASASHVPEIGMPPLELSLCPGKHDAVLMRMVARIIISHDVSSRRVNRMHVARALESILDAGFRQFRPQSKIENAVRARSHTEQPFIGRCFHEHIGRNFRRLDAILLRLSGL